MKMIRIALLLSVLLCCVNLATAQFAVGPKAGYNFNSFRGEESYDVVPGFNVGAFVEYPVLPFVTPRVEVLYMQQGANTMDYALLPPDLTRLHSKLRFHNIQIPVLAEFGLPSLNEDNLQPKLLIGGFYSYTMYARESYTNSVKIGGYDRIEYNGHSDFTPHINRVQYGLIGAIAAELKVKSLPVSVEFRYHYNMNRINRPGSQQLSNLRLTHEKWGSDLNLSTLSINVGVTLFYF